MNKKNILSAVISVYNGEKVIEKCLKSVSFASEIIVVDNSSTDKTAEIAKKYTNKIFIQKNNPSQIDIQKNFGFAKASSDWILSVDADEEVSEELVKEILCVLKNKDNVDGFWIPRENIIFNKWIEHSGWYPDLQLRLFRKGKGKFDSSHVHKSLVLNGVTKELKEHIIHHNYDTVHQFLTRAVNIYAPNEAEQIIKNGYVFDWRDAIRFPVKEFLSRYFARGGYKDGLHGLVLSLLMAFYHFMIFCFIWEKYKFKEVNDAAMLSEVEKEAVQSSKDMFFWFSKEKTEFIKNPVVKNLYKALKKIKP